MFSSYYFETEMLSCRLTQVVCGKTPRLFAGLVSEGINGIVAVGGDRRLVGLDTDGVLPRCSHGGLVLWLSDD